ncbi:MAG: carbohydrate kinase family protein [Thermofilaceae archaeon]
MRVVSVGNVNIDLLVYVDEFPEAGGRVEARVLARSPGGAAANYAVAAAKLGARAVLYGCVGSDEEGERLLKLLEEAGVDTSCVKRVEGQTGTAIVIVDSKGERTMIIHKGANANLRKAVREGRLPPTDWVHAASVPPDLAAEVFSEAKRLGALASYDPGGTYVRSGFDRILEAVKLVDVLFLNEVEASVLASSGAGNELEVLRRIVPIVVVKRGSRGSMAWVGEAFCEAEAFRVAAVDTTGAGDVFDAAFTLAVLLGLECREALTFANACAAIKVARRGAQSGPTLAEALEFLEARGFAELASLLCLLSESFNR